MIAGTYAGLRWGEAPARSAPPLRFGSVERKGGMALSEARG